MQKETKTTGLLSTPCQPFPTAPLHEQAVQDCTLEKPPTPGFPFPEGPANFPPHNWKHIPHGNEPQPRTRCAWLCGNDYCCVLLSPEVQLWYDHKNQLLSTQKSRDPC